jgi:hypothetical protein
MDKNLHLDKKACTKVHYFFLKIEYKVVYGKIIEISVSQPLYRFVFKLP